MTEGLIVAALFFVLFVILPAVLGLVFERVRGNRPRPVVMSADNARAKATLAYYNEVHDSHSG